MSYSPVFADSEKVILFLKAQQTQPAQQAAQPAQRYNQHYRLVGARQGKRTIRDGEFVIDGVRISPENFSRALGEQSQKRSEGMSLRPLLESLGTVVHPFGRTEQNADTPSSKVVDQNPSAMPNGPVDRGGGTLSPSELPTIRK